MSQKKECLVMFRRSDFHPQPVICCVVPIPDGSCWAVAKERALRWKDEFQRKFPEFKQSEFYTEEAELL